MNDNHSPKEYPQKIDSGLCYDLPQSKPRPAIIYEIPDEAITIYAEREYMIETYSSFLLPTLDMYNPELAEALRASTGEDITVNKYEDLGTEDMQSALFDALVHDRAALFDESAQSFVPFLTKKTTGIREDYRTSRGKDVLSLPNGTVIYSYTWVT